MIDSCPKCDRVGKVMLIAAATPTEVPAHYQEANRWAAGYWVQVACTECGYRGLAFPLDPERPRRPRATAGSGKCWLGLHFPEHFGDRGVNSYYQCKRCGERWVARQTRGCVSPVDHYWLMGAPWGWDVSAFYGPPPAPPGSAVFIPPR